MDNDGRAGRTRIDTTMNATVTLRCGLNSQEERETYLSALNQCFPGWGDHAHWAWCFDRSVAGRTADVLQAFASGSIVAGSAVTYRHVRRSDGAVSLAGIMTGSWTLPAARGTGVFTRMIAASIDVAGTRGAGALLAFVTAANPSRRRLEEAGASLTPSFYCRAGDARGFIDPRVRDVQPPPGLDLRGANDGPACTFAYTSEEWRGQFVERPGNVRLLEVPGRWAAVVEYAGAFERLHALRVVAGTFIDAIDALTAHARAHARQLFVFTTSPVDASTLRGRAFDITDGFLTELSTGVGTSRPPLSDATSWHLQNGDRM